ncbi:DUF4340 domain-containing protein [Nisaea sp.]|uniref:DUF4340 domain-containing protein n=1 Tax=Nisaea sp. TaxID=2024842 RepID=UPI0032EF245E
MLSLRSLGILAAVTAAVVLAAGLAVFWRHDATISGLEDARAFPGLEQQIPDIARIEISWNRDAAVEQVSIARADGVWRVAEQNGYPADTGKIRDFILSLAELKLVEAKTADPARYARLGVSDVTAAGSEATRVRLLGRNGDAIVDALIGRDRSSGTGGAMLYLRQSGDARSWLAHGQVGSMHSMTAWTDGEVIDIGADRIQEIHLTAPNSDVLEVRRVDDSKTPFKLMNMPEDRKFATFYTLNEITDGLSQLTFEDVRAIQDMTFEPSLGNAIYQTRGGLTVIVDFAQVPGASGAVETWTHFSVNVAPDATEEAKSFAAANAERLSAWAYRLSDSRLQRLRHTMESATVPATEG